MGKRNSWRPGAALARLLAILLVAALVSIPVPAEETFAEGTLLQTGNYYVSPAPDGGNSPDRNATGLISSENGALLDGLPTTYAGWMGSATSKGTIQVVFDLLKDYPLDSINLVLNSPNMYWALRSLRSSTAPNRRRIITILPASISSREPLRPIRSICR